MRAEWSTHAGQDCLSLTGVPSFEVRPATAFADAPAMAGTLVTSGDAVCFVPRFGFLAGTTYSVSVEGAVVASLTRPAREAVPTADVIAIHPTAAVVPRNVLRCYVTFSQPMSEGQAHHVRLIDSSGEPLQDALLPLEYELWDAEHRRLTVLLDPARIKRGLVGHQENGYPLRMDEPFRLVVDRGFLDAHGVGLRSTAHRDYVAGEDLRGHVAPSSWRLTPPPVGTCDALRVDVDRPLDRALLGRCVTVAGVPGSVSVGDGERSFMFVPDRPWQAGAHRLLVDPVLEDCAGNSVTRVFDRDLAEEADRPADETAVEVPFEIG